VVGRLDPGLPTDAAARSPLAKAWRTFDKTLQEFIADQLIEA
jgi:hypothetical protein